MAFILAAVQRVANLFQNRSESRQQNREPRKSGSFKNVPKNLRDRKARKKEKKASEILRQNSNQRDDDLRLYCDKRPPRGSIRVEQATENGKQFFCEPANHLPKGANYPQKLDKLAVIDSPRFHSQVEGGLLDREACIRGVLGHVLISRDGERGRRGHLEDFRPFNLDVSHRKQAAEKLVDFVASQLDSKDCYYLYERRSHKGRDFTFVVPVLSRLDRSGDFTPVDGSGRTLDDLVQDTGIRYLLFVVGFPAKYDLTRETRRFVFEREARVDRVLEKDNLEDCLIIRTMYVAVKFKDLKAICQQGLKDRLDFRLAETESKENTRTTRRRSQS